MRIVLIGSITGIVLATVFLGMSEIAQSVSAITATTQSGTVASTHNIRNGPTAVAPPGVHGGAFFITTPHAFIRCAQTGGTHAGC